MKRLTALLSLFVPCLIATDAHAKQPPVRLACVAVDASEAKRVKGICSSVGANPGVKLVTRPGVWKTASKHGLTTEFITGRYFKFKNSGPVLSTLKELDLEALMFVQIESDERAHLVTFGFDGDRTRNPLPLTSGKPDPKKARQFGGFAVRDTLRRIPEFRKIGGWNAVVTEAELQGLDPNERKALKIKRGARCYHFKKTWHFCMPDRIGTSGFVFGKKGKPFKFVKAGGSFVQGVQIGRFTEGGFERPSERRMTSPDFDPFVGGGAPALLVKPSEGRAALACGQQTEFLTAISHAESRKLLADVTIRFAPAVRSVRLMKTKSGVYAWEESIQHASGEAEFRVFVGKPPKMREKHIVDRAYYSDGGTTVYAFKDGGGLFFPANMWFMDLNSLPEDGKEEEERTLPDGTKMPKSAKIGDGGFKWSRLIDSGGGKGENLYVVDEAERQSVITNVQAPLPVQNAEASDPGVCASVLPGAKQ